MSLTAINNALKKLTADMNRQFKEMRQQFKQVDRRFEQVDRRFEQVDKRFEQVDKRFEQVDENLTKLFSQHHDLDKYVKEEVATKAELKSLEATMNERFDKQDVRFNTMDCEVAANQSAIRRLEKHVGIAASKP